MRNRSAKQTVLASPNLVHWDQPFQTEKTSHHPRNRLRKHTFCSRTAVCDRWLLSARRLLCKHEPHIICSWREQHSRTGTQSRRPQDSNYLEYIARFINTKYRHLFELDMVKLLEKDWACDYAALSNVWGVNGQQVTLNYTYRTEPLLLIWKSPKRTPYRVSF